MAEEYAELPEGIRPDPPGNPGVRRCPEDELFDLMDHSNPNRDGDRLINSFRQARPIDGRSGEPFLTRISGWLPVHPEAAPPGG